MYNVTDNRIIINDYFAEQDERGNIHVYRKGSMEYFRSLYDTNTNFMMNGLKVS